MFMWPVFIYPGMMMHGATQKLLNDPVTWKGCTSPSPFQRLAARCAMVDGITCIAFKRKKEENICKPCLSFLNATDKDVPLACGSSWQTLRLATRMRRTKKRNEEEKRGERGGIVTWSTTLFHFPFLETTPVGLLMVASFSIFIHVTWPSIPANLAFRVEKVCIIFVGFFLLFFLIAQLRVCLEIDLIPNSS